MTIVKDPLIVAVVYLWIGFVCAISFMEAWLKFRAPGVNLSIGLAIGRLVFQALNKVEWVFAIAIILNFFFSKASLFSSCHFFFYLPLLLLILQTVWLLPALDVRAQMYMDGKTIPPSNLHWFYVAAEIVKVTCLFIFSFKLFKSI